MNSLLSRDFAQLKAGDEVILRKEFSAAAIDAFARFSGDVNPLHVDDAFARRTRFGRRIAHGMLSAAYVSALIGVHLPGPGALWLAQSFEFVAPVFIGDEIEFCLRIEHTSKATRTVAIRVEGRNQHGAVVLRGRGSVMIPSEISSEGASDRAGTR